MNFEVNLWPDLKIPFTFVLHIMQKGQNQLLANWQNLQKNKRAKVYF